MMSKGKLFTFPRKIEIDNSVVDESRKNASFVVEKIEFKESLELLHSILPESYLVTARRLKESQYDPNGEVIEFYTCGSCQNVFNGELEIIGEFIEKN